MSIGVSIPLRAIPKNGGGDRYFDMGKLTFDQREEVRVELEKQGFFVQYLMLDDASHVLFECRIRKQIEAEQEATSDHR